MKTKTLTKDCRCASCGEMMRAGEAFAWKKGFVSRPSYARGAGSGMLVKTETFRPQHVHDCAGKRVKERRDEEARDLIDRACAMAKKYGESPEWIAEYRAKLLSEAGL